MSHLPTESIKIIAEFAGIADLKDDVAQALAQDIEYRLRDIIQEAMKFMRHAKRSKLSTEDINHALKVRNLEVFRASIRSSVEIVWIHHGCSSQIQICAGRWCRVSILRRR